MKLKMSNKILVYYIKWESWLAIHLHVSLTNKFMDLFDQVREFVIGCKFSACHSFWRIFGGQNI